MSRLEATFPGQGRRVTAPRHREVQQLKETSCLVVPATELPAPRSAGSWLFGTSLRRTGSVSCGRFRSPVWPCSSRHPWRCSSPGSPAADRAVAGAAAASVAGTVAPEMPARAPEAAVPVAGSLRRPRWVPRPGGPGIRQQEARRERPTVREPAVALPARPRESPGRPGRAAASSPARLVRAAAPVVARPAAVVARRAAVVALEVVVPAVVAPAVVALVVVAAHRRGAVRRRAAIRACAPRSGAWFPA
ncbi:MAG: hypothetical protein JWP40_4009 [Blastococcus sp.]|nr:hypothetical protein [Blastococcus sp.]